MVNRRTLLKSALLLSVSLGFGCSRTTPKFMKLPSGSKVVALGDSLTFGYGADQSQSYPAMLAIKTRWHIDNDGINGDTSEGVLNRLDAVIAKKPKLVLLGVGGNDVLQRINPATTKTHLMSIIKKLQDNHIAVVLIAEPYLSASVLFGKASDNPIYKEIAKELDVPLFSEGWSKILSDDKLKSDQIHANALGYEKFAQMLYEYLQEIGYV